MSLEARRPTAGKRAVPETGRVMNAKDWRLQHLEHQPYLRGVSFIRKTYRAYRPGWEHDHCAACWQEFVEPGVEADGAIHEGYATTDDYEKGAEYDWVCPACFEAFASDMDWRDLTKRSLN
jgi:hypothetical protein